MNFQERLIEVSADLRARAAALTTAALDLARSSPVMTPQRIDALKASFGTLSVAGRELNKVTRRHASRFVKENSAIVVAAGKDVSALARSTYASLARAKAPATKARKSRASRKRAASKAA